MSAHRRLAGLMVWLGSFSATLGGGIIAGPGGMLIVGGVLVFVVGLMVLMEEA